MTRLDEIKARLDAATQEPLEGSAFSEANIGVHADSADGFRKYVASFWGNLAPGEHEANANLFIHAPSDLRYLIAEVERMRGALLFYGYESNYAASVITDEDSGAPEVLKDDGARARAALDGGSEPERERERSDNPRPRSYTVEQARSMDPIFPPEPGYGMDGGSDGE